MSDRERSPSPRNGTRSHSGKEGKPTRLSRSRSRTPIKMHKRSMSNDGYRGRYRSRSRSGSEGRGNYHRGSRGRYSYSRSRSRSYSPRGYRRSHSRSPMSSRRRHVGDRDNPTQSRCLGVFGLSIYTSEQQINHIFSKYGPVERVQVVIDAKTSRSRGFCFVYFESSADAKAAKDECTGMEIDGRRIRVDYSITQRAHTPTPGVYMGKATFFKDRYQDDRRRDRDDNHYGSSRGYYRGGDNRRRSSPSYYRGSGDRSGYRRSRYDKSRSRSYSPRRY